jgi:hypothetical protein
LYGLSKDENRNLEVAPRLSVVETARTELMHQLNQWLPRRRTSLNGSPPFTLEATACHRIVRTRCE